MKTSEAFRIGMEDGIEGFYCPEAIMNFVNMNTYTEGFLSVNPTHQIARKCANAGQIDRHTSQAQLDRAAAGETFEWEYDSHENTPGMAEAQPSI